MSLPRTHHVRQVCSPVKTGIRLNDVAALVHVSVDESSNGRKLGNDVDAVLHDWLPVIELVDALAVGCCKLTVGLQHSSTEA